MATLYSYTFAEFTGATGLPATFHLSDLTPDEGTTHAEVTSINVMFFASHIGTYTMGCKILQPGDTWSDYSTEEVIWAGEDTQIITFTFSGGVNASISHNRFEVYLAKTAGPGYPTYAAQDDTDTYFVVEGEWAATGDPLPEKPITPAPANAASDVTLDQETITWEDGGGADTYDVYYGDTSGSLSLLSGGQAALTYTIDGITLGSPFDYSVTRYWRIDAINAVGTTTGDEWSFTSMVFDPPVPTGAGNANPNMMQVIKRLVAAARDKIWYEDI